MNLKRDVHVSWVSQCMMGSCESLWREREKERGRERERAKETPTHREIHPQKNMTEVISSSIAIVAQV